MSYNDINNNDSNMYTVNDSNSNTNMIDCSERPGGRRLGARPCGGSILHYHITL